VPVDQGPVEEVEIGVAARIGRARQPVDQAVQEMWLPFVGPPALDRPGGRGRQERPFADLGRPGRRVSGHPQIEREKVGGRPRVVQGGVRAVRRQTGPRPGVVSVKMSSPGYASREATLQRTVIVRLRRSGCLHRTKC
jgi:hypothetical protein